MDGLLGLSGLARPPARFQLVHDPLEQRQLGLRVLVAGARSLARLLEPALDHSQVR